MTALDLEQGHPDLLRELTALVGAEHVLTGDEDLAFYSQDIYRSADQPAAVVVRPGTPEEVAHVTAAATAAGFSVIARGGGTSYTGGLLPDRPNSVVVDTARLDRIVEINAEDMYVLVEAGCTWKQIHRALEPLGVRPPFWGPLSGGVCTVGGSLSQGAILHGSALHGLSAESVIGLEVVLADGSLVPTGAGATVGGKPFFRYYGPDLTGLFLGDTGALGIKVRAALRLVPIPPSARFASFEFSQPEPFAQALAEVARAGLATMCFGMDPNLQRQRMKRSSQSQDVKAVKVVVAGRSPLEKGSYSIHYIVEGRDESEAEGRLAALRAICTRHGHEVENTIPKAIHGDPFFPMTTAIGPRGERWAPVHGIVPLSDGAAALSRLEGLLADHASEMERCGVVVGLLLSTVATNGFVIEPVFYWPGPRTLYYERMLEPESLAKFEDFEFSPDAVALVADLRTKVLDTFQGLGAVHLQVGKTYPYRQGRDANTWRLLEAIKSAVDPNRLINPKNLGLD